MNRNACPGTQCKCGFSQNPTLYPTLTNSRVQTALGNIRTTPDFYRFLESEGVPLSDANGEWHFPLGVCMRIRDKLLTKMKSLGVEFPKRNLFSSNILLPATGPDDEKEPSTGSGGIPLKWDEHDTNITRAWNPNSEQLLLDE